MTARALPRLDEDTRLVPILNNLSQGFLAGVSSEWSTASSGNGTEITADMVDDLSRKHFPVCMRNLHESLRRDRHLKHFGRLQYGLFLKVTISYYHYSPLPIQTLLEGLRPFNRRSNHFLAQIIQ